MKPSSIQRWLFGIILLALAQNAQAEGFSMGAGFDLPSLLEVRVGYEARDFGVRAYLDVLTLWAGVDGYAKLPLNDSGLSFMAGAGVITDFKSVGFRGVIGWEWVLAANVALVAELRPILLPSLWASDPNPLINIGNYLLQSWLLFSASFALEYRF